MTGVSVVLPVFNGAAHLEEALASLYQQTRAPDEIIVVDDGSTDASPSILEKHRSSIRCIRTANRGLASARNEGVTAARGPFVAFLDQDDRWWPKKLEIFLSWVAHYPEAEFLFSDAMTISPKGGRVRRMRCDPGPGDLFGALFRRNSVVSSTVVLTKALWDRAGPFRNDFAHPAAVVDYEFFLRASRLGAALYIGEILTDYRVHKASSLRGRLNDVQADQQKVLSLQDRDATISPTQKEMARAIASYDSGVRHLAAWDVLSARDAFASACRSKAMGWKARLSWWLTFLPHPLLALARGGRDQLSRLTTVLIGRHSPSRRVRYYARRSVV